MPKIGVSELAPALAWPKYFYQGFNRQYFRKVLAERPMAYWPLWEASGSVAYDISGNGLHGTYSGVTLGAAGPDGKRSCPYFDGSAGYVDVYSTGLNTLLDGSPSTICLWLKMNAAGLWSDAGHYAFFQLFVDGDNKLMLRKHSADIMWWFYNGEGGIGNEYQTQNSTGYGAGWHFMAITRDETADEIKAYHNGVKVGATLTNLGVFTGNLDSDECVIGAYNTTPANPHHGWLADAMIFDKVLSATQMLDLSLR